MERAVFKIGEVASILATSIRTIRYYEEELLLKPIRTKKGTRLYSDTHVERLRVILSLVKIGFSIESIREISNAREECLTGKASSQRVTKLFDSKILDIDNLIQELNNIKDDINSAKEVIRSCGGCGNHPSSKGCPDCPVKLKLKEIAMLNLVWDTDA